MYVTPFVSVTHVQNILCSVACLIFNFFFVKVFKILVCSASFRRFDEIKMLMVCVCYIIRDYDDVFNIL